MFAYIFVVIIEEIYVSTKADLPGGATRQEIMEVCQK